MGLLTMSKTSVYCTCMCVMMLMSLLPETFSASITVTIASSVSVRDVSHSSLWIRNARVTGKAEPLRVGEIQ